jgi:hypothetical protein
LRRIKVFPLIGFQTHNVVIQVNDLRELCISGGIFTWFNNHTNPTLERLDGILMSREREFLFPSVCGYKEQRCLSDRDPLIWSTAFWCGGGIGESSDLNSFG